jgi:N-acetyl-anhydromuramyl-L-alanine amidase AmpD
MSTITIDRQWRLTDNQYFKEETEKTNICLHHTVGGSAKSTFNYWQSNPDRIATSYIVDRDGTIYEVFDPLYWAHHLGLKLPKNTIYNQRTIGIELASEGALRSGNELNVSLGNLGLAPKFDSEYLYAFDIDTPPYTNAKKLYHIISDKEKYFDYGLLFRGYSYFDVYEESQVIATIKLVNHLCEQFDIPKQLVPSVDASKFDLSILFDDWKGIYTHTNVRVDKSDLAPSWDWDRLESSFK